MSWIEEIIKNRNNRTSLIHFVIADEFSRPIQLIKTLREHYETILLYDAWNGLQEVTFTTLKTGEVLMSVKALGDEFEGGNDPVSAFTIILEKLRTEKKCLVVVEHFDLLVKKINGIPDLNDALRYLIREFDYAPKIFGESMLVLFLNDRTTTAKDVLDHSVLYEVTGCSEEERRYTLKNLVKARTINEKWVPETNGKVTDVEGIVTAGSGLTLIQFNTALVMALSEKKLTPEYVSSAKKMILETAGIGKIITPKEALDPEKIGGYDEIKDIIKAIATKVTERNRAQELGCGDIRGILLLGAPGTGKSLLGEAFAKMTNKPVLSISAGDIFSKWYGESARMIRKIIDIAEETGAVIFIDEIEAIVGGRGNGQTQHEETSRTLGELLRYMGDYKRKSIVFGTTNRPDSMDFAMRRAGRFDRIIYVELPDLEARKAIFNVHINNPIDHPKVKLAQDVDVTKLAENTENFSGAEISQIVKDACDYAFEDNVKKVTMKHFLEAIKSNKPNMAERKAMINLYEKFASRFCRGLRKPLVESKTDEEEILIKEGVKPSLRRLVG